MESRIDPESTVESLEKISNNGENLTSVFATAEIPPDVSDAPQHEKQTNDPDDAVAEHSESSTSSSRRQSEVEGYLQIEDGPTGAKSASSRSSLSSIPDSVLVHPKDQSVYGRDSIGEIYDEQEELASYGNPVYQTIRDRNSPFRHPSSVKAIQMQTEDEEDEEIMSPSRRKAMFRNSPASVRSLGSPLLRRHGYHSAGNTPRRTSPVKRENPLVLLHCTVLQPTVILGPGVTLPDRQILEKVLPPQYARRWKLLEEKISGSGLLRDRGLLIQHPQEDYVLLEERLLESLELQKPRLENGHYNNHEASDSENESGEEKSEHSIADGKSVCVDCGCHATYRDDRRKWDIKIYAANGLMKEGAWTAAWKEIERVDVQISLWLPYEVKSEVEKKIREEIAVAAEMEKIRAAESIVKEPQPNRRSIVSQDEIDGLDDGPDTSKSLPRQEKQTLQHETPVLDCPRTKKRNTDPDLQTLIINSIRVLASDKRNIITIISMLIAVLAVAFGGRSAKRSQYGYDMARFGDFPAVSTQVYHTTSTSVLTQTSTEVPICESESRVERIGEVQRVVERVLDEAKPKAAQPVEPRQGIETAIEPVEQETIEIAVDTKVEAVETAIPDAFYVPPITQLDEPEYNLPAEVNLPVASLDTQEDDSASKEVDNSAMAQADDSIVDRKASAIILNNEQVPVQIDELSTTEEIDSNIARNGDDAISRTDGDAIPRHAIPIAAQGNDSTITQDDGAPIIETEDSAVTQKNNSIVVEDAKAPINKIEPPAIADSKHLTAQDNHSVISQDENAPNSQIDDAIIINDRHVIDQDPIVAQHDNHAIVETGLSAPRHDTNDLLNESTS